MSRVMILVWISSALLLGTGCSMNRCNNCCGDVGCRPCQMGWQRGGTDYQRFLQGPGCGCQSCSGRTGLLGGRLAGGTGGLSQHSQFANSQPAGAGEASGGPMAQVAYPYYTTRGPRDFLMDNPPTIGR